MARNKLRISVRYGVTPDEILNKCDLSLRAKGLYGFLQSKPDGWRFSVDRITANNKEGKSAIRVALNELECIGVLRREALKNSEGRWDGYDYILSEKPLSENRTTGKPTTDIGNTLSKTENSNTYKVIHETPEGVSGKEVNEMIDLFKDLNPSHEILFARVPQRKAIERLIKKHGQQNIREAIQAATKTNGMKYAPTITTPIQLEERLGSLMAFIKKKTENSTLVL